MLAKDSLIKMWGKGHPLEEQEGNYVASGCSVSLSTYQSELTVPVEEVGIATFVSTAPFK